MPDRWTRSLEYYSRAQQSLAGGVSSPFRRTFPVPLYFQDGEGSKVQDVDGNWYLDYVLAWGPMILGHKHPALVEAMRKAAERPFNYGAQHELEFTVAETICRLVPCAERVALTSSGSEAVQLVMRLARAFTGRTLIVKFEGHYHGWMDSTLLSYHPSPAQMGAPEQPTIVLGSKGQVPNVVENVVVLPWNDRRTVSEFFAGRGQEVAAVMTEPVLCNSGCLLPVPGFLDELRRITRASGSLLIFDEIITGFRMAAGGAQSVLGVVPDLASFGKAIGAGLPLSAVAGRKEIMDLLSDGQVAFGGTFNGNCLSLAGAQAALIELEAQNGEALRRANRLGEELMGGITRIGQRLGLPLQATGFGTAFSVHFTSRPVLHNYRDTLADDRELLRHWLFECLREGIFLLPDGRVYTSVAHTSEDIERTSEAFERVLVRCASEVHV